jgi:hypothetical protein
MGLLNGIVLVYLCPIASVLHHFSEVGRVVTRIDAILVSFIVFIGRCVNRFRLFLLHWRLRMRAPLYELLNWNANLDGFWLFDNLLNRFFIGLHKWLLNQI